MNIRTALALVIMLPTIVACGGGGGSSSTPTPHTPVVETPEKPKPEPVVSCTEWELNKAGDEARECEETLQDYVLQDNVWVKGDVVVLDTWTETRVGVNEATEQEVINKSDYEAFSEAYYLNAEIVEEDGVLVIVNNS